MDHVGTEAESRGVDSDGVSSNPIHLSCGIGAVTVRWITIHSTSCHICSQDGRSRSVPFGFASTPYRDSGATGHIAAECWTSIWHGAPDP